MARFKGIIQRMEIAISEKKLILINSHHFHNKRFTYENNSLVSLALSLLLLLFFFYSAEIARNKLRFELLRRKQPDPNLVPACRKKLLFDFCDRSDTLKRYRRKDITLTLPDGKTMANIKWFAVWCDEFSVSKERTRHRARDLRFPLARHRNRYPRFPRNFHARSSSDGKRSPRVANAYPPLQFENFDWRIERGIIEIKFFSFLFFSLDSIQFGT